MKVSYNWLKTLVDINLEPNELAEKIELSAVEINDVKNLDYQLKKIVVGHTIRVEDHPDSDHLHICQVDVGEEDPIQIICGAPNIDKNQDVIVALHGARITGNIKIKRSKMRGVPSNGMICALQEIGYDDSVVPDQYLDGIYVFPADSNVKPGDSVIDILDMHDTVIDTSVTPNRGDMLSMLGNAYEASAILDSSLKLQSEIKDNSNKDVKTFETPIKINVQDKKLVLDYRVLEIHDIKVHSSPFWLQKLLMKIGVRPVNNIIDITNYILFKYGQPFQVFDADKLGSDITVSKSSKAIKFKDSNEENHELRPNDLVVTSEKQIIALAGVINSESISVTNNSKNIVLQAGIFDSILIGETTRYHDIRNDGTARLERGVNPDISQQALEEVTNFILSINKDASVSEPVVGQKYESKNKIVAIDLDFINKKLGTNLTNVQVQDILKRLKFEIELSKSDVFEIKIPNRRPDLSNKFDILEEIIRIYGYEKLSFSLPVDNGNIGLLSNRQTFLRKTRQIMEGLGLTQSIGYRLTSNDKFDDFSWNNDAGKSYLGDGIDVKLKPLNNIEESVNKAVTLGHPLSDDRTTFRRSLISGLLDAVSYNKARSNKNIALYEQGSVWSKSSSKDLINNEMLAGAVSGELTPHNWHVESDKTNFYQLKGLLERYFQKINLKDIKFDPLSSMFNLPDMHPGRTALIYHQDQLIGLVGQVHPKTAEKYNIDETYVFELDLSTMMAENHDFNYYKTISNQPFITRDVSLLIDQDVNYQNVLDVIKNVNQNYLVEVQLKDVYIDDKMEDGKKSLTYKLKYQDPNVTLEEDVVNQDFEQILEALKTELKAKIR